MLWLLKYLPQNYLSTLTGHLMHWQLPGALRSLSVRVFANMYSINIDEAEKPLKEYLSIGDFFVRRLKPSVRPLAAARVVNPADAVVNAAGSITDGKMLQVKHRPYSVAQILTSPQRAKDLEGGFFATYYLCPTDYHRVHSPVSGKITSVDHVPGKLWPVYKKSVEGIADLFAVNERMVVSIETDLGLVSVVFVGAMNVGKIELAFDSHFQSQMPDIDEKRSKNYTPPIAIKAGDELGLFRMGSTVVVFYPKSYSQEISLSRLQALVGQATKVRAAL